MIGTHFKIVTMDNYKELLKEVCDGDPVVVRGVKYREIIPPVIVTPPKSIEFFEKFEKFDPYMAKARAEYILAHMNYEDVSVEFCEDRSTRRAVIYKPDWYWDKWPRHVNCVVAYQYIIRANIMRLHVFMRSSDFYNAFPYDWFAASEHLRIMAEEEEAAEGYIYWHISNLHVAADDLPRIEKFLRGDAANGSA